MSVAHGRGVLHITTFLQGGAGRAVVSLACAQRARGQDVAVVTSRTAPAGYGNYPDYLARLREAGVPLLVADSAFSRELSDSLALARTICERFDPCRFAIVHAHAATPALVGLFVAARAHRQLPVVQTMHGWGANKTAEQETRDLAVLQSIDRVIVTSGASRGELVARGVTRDRIDVIPCGIGEASPAAQPVRELEALRQAGCSVVLCIGSITRQKNQALVVDAISRLDGGRPVVAVFVGEDTEDPGRLAAHARAVGVADRVHLFGYRPDAARLLGAADVLVQPSRAEGQGLAVVEAFRARVPVVASDIPPLRELMADGAHGFLFRPDDAASLAGELRNALALNGPRRRTLLDAAERSFKARYTVGAMLASHDRLYTDVARRTVAGDHAT